MGADVQSLCSASGGVPSSVRGVRLPLAVLCAILRITNVLGLTSTPRIRQKHLPYRCESSQKRRPLIKAHCYNEHFRVERATKLFFCIYISNMSEFFFDIMHLDGCL